MHKYSSYFIRTLKEAPRDADIISHQLMIRSGMIRQVASGIYSILPIGLRVFEKLTAILRDELSKIGAVECALPHVCPSELWQASGRWSDYGDELLRFQDRADRSFCFGPTHEEVITDLIGSLTPSYKQLPISIFQIQTKFRDETRPRFGLMRAREFLMKDAYSFHATQDSLNETFNHYRSAYAAIFKRCGVSFIEAHADSGSIGGDQSSEFLVIADSGEDEVMVSENQRFAANIEACPCVDPPINHDVSTIPTMATVSTPNQSTIADISNYLGVASDCIMKTLLVMDAKDQPVMVCLRGDVHLNQTKLTALLGNGCRLGSSNDVIQTLQCPVGFIGPVGVSSIPIYMDTSLYRHPSYVCGANTVDTHVQFVVIARDIGPVTWVDIRNAQTGDASPIDATQRLVSKRGIEVGHVFKLGEKYAKSMGLQFTNQAGTMTPYIMGCYGIGVGRTIAATIEQHHDDKGIIWPRALAPFDGVVLNLFPNDPLVTQRVSDIATALHALGLTVIVDDRMESPGVKFKDAELIGYPFYIGIGKKTLHTTNFECVIRRTGDVILASIDQLDVLISHI